MELTAISALLQSAATTGNGSAADLKGQQRHATVYCEGSGTISGGTVSIEEARSESYSGTWSVVATVPAADVTGGAVKAVHIVGTFLAVRARVSSNVTGGGNVTVQLVAN